jgi:predicted transcriptional regulator
MKQDLFLSLHPNWAQRILTGRKTAEIRRVGPRRDLVGSRAVIYETGARDGAVVGFAEIEEVAFFPPCDPHLTGVPDQLNPLDASLLDYQSRSSVGVFVFREYLKGAKSPAAILLRPGSAVPLRRPIRRGDLEDLWAGFRVPQSFRYVSPADVDRLIRLSGGTP